VAWFADLSPYSYLPVDRNQPFLAGERERTVNVGWLSPLHRYRTGRPPEGLLPALTQFALNGKTAQTRGFHRCSLGFCIVRPRMGVLFPTPERDLLLGSAEIRVRGARVFAAPDLVLHYVASHRYLPPDEFVDTVLQTSGRG
jgi:hypothetical protein